MIGEYSLVEAIFDLAKRIIQTQRVEETLFLIALRLLKKYIFINKYGKHIAQIFHDYFLRNQPFKILRESL